MVDRWDSPLAEMTAVSMADLSADLMASSTVEMKAAQSVDVLAALMVDPSADYSAVRKVVPSVETKAVH